MTDGRRIGGADHIEIRGARVNNLKHVDVDIPLNRLVAVAGVSGSGKSSLALDVLYAEGSRRYLDALSTYTRRRMTQAQRPQIDEARYLPPALALRQRPGVGGVRSTFGTMTELLNVLRLMFSRLAHHRCPNGHYHAPTIAVAAETPFFCDECGARIDAPGAEMLAFNSTGACPRCQGTGLVRDVDDATLVPDDSLTIDEGAVLPWKMFGWRVQNDIAREFGVRTDVPFRDLTDKERDIVFNGPEEKKHIVVTSMKGVHELDFTFRNARLTVTKELERAADEKRLARVMRFVTEHTCPDCDGTRLSEAARWPLIDGINLAQATAMTLDGALVWVRGVPAGLPDEMRPMAQALADTFEEMGQRLVQLGLGYLGLDRSGESLSTGERQRAQLARAVRNETTGVLYVLDEPSTGLHPANMEGLVGVMRDLLGDGNSVVFVDHDVNVLRAADYFIEMGPGAGVEGGRVIAQGSPDEIIADPNSRIAGFLAGREPALVRERQTASAAAVGTDENASFDDAAVRSKRKSGKGGKEAADHGGDTRWLRMRTEAIHTVRPLDVAIPVGRLTAVTGVSGSGKTTMVLESLVPALQAAAEGRALPKHVSAIDAAGIDTVRIVDSTPIGVNVRSTLATYSGIMDLLRRAFAATDEAQARGLALADFSYNTGSLRCPQCDGAGRVNLDVQFLPDVTIACPACEGTRYRDEVNGIRLAVGERRMTLPQILAMSVDALLDVFEGRASRTADSAQEAAAGSRRNATAPADKTNAHDAAGAAPADATRKRIAKALRTLHDLGLGYLTLGEDTPSLSGGEAQRLKLSNELGKRQRTSLFVLDEPTVGLHPLDVRTLIGVLQRLLDGGATIVVIEHDLDLIANADHVIDMGPGGGEQGGRIVATGSPERIAAASESVTGRYLRALLG
ncbi:excinuclease ABC subunit A [Bifidobacterium lemurum]|uniref:UvrABC system protein A n=1 Tax=Bifidobacterium lemurum TaxID=1603886 RepID=A0A261FT86_9BIFI|nr:excinuclease ABC subunit A [Bifidobacterium lemurum]OZG62404.1 excinuclease ABC subunit A [Bifidobacterium lemurum]QOL33755.1 excinuclease ABC subunit UvrA [Bifidobacterium lemurum]